MDHDVFLPAAWWVIPFVTLLLAIAILPFAAPHLWESNVRKLIVSLALGLPVAVYYASHEPAVIGETVADYLSFMILLGSLFVISGGVVMDGDLEARPWVNVSFLGMGALLASFIGTTGASMLLIRPLLHTNAERRHVVHTIVFFIFVVSNIGGCLTPLGDPPLFLGYLEGVPFTWTFRLLPAWLFATVLLLAIYFVWDTILHAKEPPERLTLDAARVKPLRIAGAHNLVLLGAIVAATAFLPAFWREAAMVALAGVSWTLTNRHLHRANHFTFGPILEVAVLFLGIFMTMMPALDILRARGGELGVTHPWHFFWATGTLSSFLDNAPTYLTFLALAQGQRGVDEILGMSHEILAAISLGAVFMGANTYIGNGPNFMVRSIAESRGVKMPGFGGYMLYSGAVLIPVFVLITFVFFRG
jgi:Na+/H+ antiporter NhaD/arsenite permease-like protein